MKKYLLSILLLLFSVNHVDAYYPEENLIPLPDQIPLSFRTTEGVQWKQDLPITNWKKFKTAILGEINGNPVILHLYLEKEVHAVLEYKKLVHKIPFVGHIPEEIIAYPLSLQYKKEDTNVHLIGGVGSTVGGVTYLFFDEQKKEWGNFHQFGIPQALDVNHDDQPELVIDFPGMHGNPADVYFVRWNRDRFEEVSINDSLKVILPTIKTPQIKISSIMQGKDIQVMVSQPDKQIERSALYKGYY